MAGSALLWRGGHYSFGNADTNSAPNRNGYGDQVLQQEQARMQNNGNPRNPDVMVAEDENSLLNPKKRRSRPPYDPNVLLSEKGLDSCYQMMSTLKFKGAGHERSDLKKLIHHYKQWAYFMYPSMNFNDIVKKTLTFSSKNQIKNHLQRLRDKRDGHDVIGEDDEDDDQDLDLLNNGNNNNNNQNNGNDMSASNVVEDDNGDIGMNRNNNNNDEEKNSNDLEVRQQRQLPREADDSLNAQIQTGANRDSENTENNSNRAAGNNTDNNNNNNNDNNHDMDEFDWGNPYEFEPNDHDIELANLMYG